MDLEGHDKQDGDESVSKEKRPKLMTVTRGKTFQCLLQPLSMLPEEVWEDIVSRVSSLDRLSVCRTNSQLEAAFGQRKSQWLLDQVLPFLIKHFNSRSSLLKCRSVCKGWRNVVDKFLEEDHPSRRSFNPDHVIERVNAKRATVYSSLRRCQLEHVQFTPANLHKFLSFPTVTPSIPKPPVVIGRAVSFQVNGMWREEEVQEFLEAAKAFLQTHGRDLWHFKLVQYNPHLQPSTRFYRLLWECLDLLPNLRTLEVRTRLDMFNDDENRSLVPIIRAFPLPALPRLESIAIKGVPMAIQAHFLAQYGAQLEKLLVDMYDGAYEVPGSLPAQLKQVSLKRVSNYNSLRNLSAMSVFPTACTKMTLDMTLCRRVDQGLLLEVLQRFRTLLHLRIILHSRCSYATSSMSGKLPSVQYFEIEGDGRDVFHFCALLHALPSLQYLHLRDTSSNPGNNSGGGRPSSRIVTRDNANVEIEEYLHRDALQESPVWNTLQNLQVLTFESVNGSLKKSFCNRETVKHWRQARMSSGSNY